MHILVTSDIHANIEQMRWLTTTAKRADLLLLAGDLLDNGSEVEMVTDWLLGLPCPLAVASGNHDAVNGLDWLYDLRANGRMIDEIGSCFDVPVACLPWEYPDGDWIQQATRDCYDAAQQARGRFIILAHCLPPPRYQGVHCADRVEVFRGHIAGMPLITGHDHEFVRYRNAWIATGQTGHRIPNHCWLDWTGRRGSLVTREESRNAMTKTPFRF